MDDKRKQKIAMSGSTGFVGKNLTKAFKDQGWGIVALGRKDFAEGVDELARKINGCGIVINLAGAPIINRWTEVYKKVLYESRIDVTRKIVLACEQLSVKPDLFISTSAIGYYTESGIHTEQDYTHAADFLGDLTQKWEEEALQADKLGIRTIIFRFGVVLGKNGGALKQMLLPFQLGLGGRIGDGKQPFSFIHVMDLVNAYLAVINSESYAGIYNLTAPQPTTNLGLTKALGKALKRPTFLPVPSFILKLKFGEGASVLTSGQKALPERLLESNFTFMFPDIESAVADCVATQS